MDIVRSLIFGAFIYFVLQFWAERFNEVHKEEDDEYRKKEKRKELIQIQVRDLKVEMLERMVASS